MNINQRKSGDVIILDLEGRLAIGDGDSVLRGNVRDLLADGARKILLNLEKVTYVDSAGLGEMVSSYTTTSREGGKLKLLKPSRKLYDLLMITRLITVFDSYDDEKEAVESFA
jgi:anti-sigma B factor antagonist